MILWHGHLFATSKKPQKTQQIHKEKKLHKYAEIGRPYNLTKKGL